ncbi:hypothetical protein BCR35DRAFT_300502 [Leucosporidium creatinivorum]|uniref:Uncharacterized protein n=1 Tax=Leucosporidium creatinivorum TaxID=106004 RepID=A0A1Y2FYZ9_9BASI|nr:hypothetical protein BCR35DRAFT_300502 [Leucosporidium creatinivorum]
MNPRGPPPVQLEGRAALRKDLPSTSSIIRDAKGLALELRGMLKRKDPWDREVEFQREALRKAYLQIIFSPPHASASSSASLPPTSTSSNPLKATTSSTSAHHAARSLDALGLLWLETTHALIHLYRSKLTEMDKTIAESPQAHRRGPRGGGLGGAMPPPGPTARRRLIHSFRTFLGQEEDFYRVLLGRLAASLYPSDLVGLRTLGVVVDYGGEEEEEVQRTDEERKSLRSKAVPLAHKALICFGDLARYRELYNEANGGGGKKEGGGGGGGRRGKGKTESATAGGERKVKNWSRAAECYHQARLLLPDNGNPSNQLAVLSQYASDPLSSTYHYYRALSVRSPFPTARTNLEITYTKAVNRWFADESAAQLGEGDEGARFRVAFVALQGLYFVKTRLPDIAALSQHTQDLFKTAVENRLLTSDTIVKAVVTSLCALWNARVFRSGKKTTSSSSRVAAAASSTASLTTTSINLEPHILLHVLSFYRILLSIGSSETNELLASNDASPSTDPIPLAQNISAVLRRTLPALRILSKWIMGQLEYITRVEARVEAKERKITAKGSQRESLEHEAQDPTAAADESMDLSSVSSAHLAQELEAFWSAFADFGNSMMLAFPLEELPSAVEGGVWLEEDVDLLGFAPLRRGMKEGVGAADAVGQGGEIARVGKDVHPNEEQLMRIQELQVDAALIAEAESALITIEHGAFVFSPRGDDPSPESLEAREVALAAERIAAAFPTTGGGAGLLEQVDEGVFEEEEEEEEVDGAGEMGWEGAEEIEDDPVDLAMRIGEVGKMEMDDEDLEGDEDDDEDEHIVYQSRSASQTGFPGAPASLPRSNFFPPPANSPSRPTSDHLLHHVLGVPTSAASPPSAFAQSSLLPGSPPIGSGAGRSIWSDSPQLQQPSFVTRGSFESLPNMTHQAFQPQATSNSPNAGSSAWARPSPFDGSIANNPLPPAGSNVARHPSFSSGGLSPLGPGQPGSPPLEPLSLFGNFSPFASPSRSAALPLPVPSHNAATSTPSQHPHAASPATAATLLSDLSPSAAAFVSKSPQKPPGLPLSPAGAPPNSSTRNVGRQRQHGFG